MQKHNDLSLCNLTLSKANIASKVQHLINKTCGTCAQPHVLFKLYIELVRPHVEFTCQVWSAHQLFLIDTIERVH